MQTQYLNAGGYDLTGSYNSSPFIKAKEVGRSSLQEKVRMLSAQIISRKELSKMFEKEAQSRINQLTQEKVAIEYFRHDSSAINDSVRKIRTSIQEEKRMAWNEIRDLEIELINTELEMNRKEANSNYYQNNITEYRPNAY